MKIAIITNGSVEMGMGHVYRSISLANELKNFNVRDIVFLTKSDDDVIKKIAKNNFEVIKCNDNNHIIYNIKNIKPDVVIIDDLGIEENFAKNIRNLCKKLLFFDNLNSLSNKYADVVVNAIVRSRLKNLKYFDEENKTLYFYGPKYLILRDEFYRVKKEILRKDEKRKMENILIAFGGSDPSNLTCKVLEKLLSKDKNFSINIVLGPIFQYENELNDLLKKHNGNRIKIYKNINNMAELMRDNDLVITSPGMTMFEALFLEIPVVVLYQNELQRECYDDYLKKISKTHLNPLKEGYFIDAEHTDLHIGKGKFEIIEAITNIYNCKKIDGDSKIIIRQITDNDLELLMAWRSNPLIYKFFYIQKEPLKWEEHYSWWMSRENRVDWIILLRENNTIRKVGSVNVSQLNTDNPEIGILIGEFFLWGKHIGRHSVSLVLKWLKNIGYKKAHARILENNIRSIKLFESLGFKKTKKGRENEWIYEVNL